MRIITWNCQGALRKKIEEIMSYYPDILVVPESEHFDKFPARLLREKIKDCFWYGDNKSRGIGVYSFSSYTIKILPAFNSNYRYIIPLSISGLNESFVLIAVWAMNNKENYEAWYIGQVWLAINHYSSLLDESIIIVGDFNSNKIWDYKDRVGNHSDVVQKLSSYNIYSSYHHHHGIDQGQEVHPTFYLHRNQKKPYHIDYCFCSRDYLQRISLVDIGKYEDWRTLSDHVPVIVDFENSWS